VAVLSDADRLELQGEFIRTEDTAGRFGTLVKADIRAALNAIDQWVSDNAAAFNSAIPQPARAQLTSAQKARLLWYVARKRFDKGV
jgi:hypothetical protein